MTIDRQQMTIQFNVDELKLSHTDKAVLDNLVKQLNDVFQTSKEELTETKGHLHKYLGLTISRTKSLLYTILLKT